MDAVRVEDKRRIGNVVFAGGLGKAEALLEDAENGFGHGLGPPRFERAAFAEPQIVH